MHSRGVNRTADAPPRVFARAVLAVAALAVPHIGFAQCPNRISANVINSFRTPEIRNALASVFIDQAFIDQNRGAQAMIDTLRLQNAELDRAIRQNENCVAESSQNPAA